MQAIAMKCSKCQSDSFEKDMVLTKTLDEDAAHSTEDIFDVHVCKTCRLTQWYDYYIVNGEPKPQKSYDKHFYKLPQLPAFRCSNCESQESTTEVVAPYQYGAKSYAGEILIRVCLQCGLSELYDILLYHVGAGHFDLEKREKLAQGFACSVCGFDHVDKTGHVSFVMKPTLKRLLESKAVIDFIFATCKKCRRMTLYTDII